MVQPLEGFRQRLNTSFNLEVGHQLRKTRETSEMP